MTDSSINFCAQPRRFIEIRVADIEQLTRRRVQRLCRPDDRHGLVVLPFFGLWIVAIVVAAHTTGGVAHASVCTMSVLALLGLSVCLHEASHALLFRRRWINEFVGLLCGLPVLIPVSAFRSNHRLHHARRGDSGQPVEERLDFALFRSLPVYVLALIVKSFGFITVLPVIAFATAGTRVRLRTLTEYAAFAAIVRAVLQHVPWPLLWWVWLLPLIVTALLSQIRAVAEHGLTTKGNTFTASRTVVSNRLLCLLMCNINYHLEHHLFPTLPWYQLPAAHVLLREQYQRTGASVYRSYCAFFADFLRATWRGIRPATRLIALERR